MSAPTAKAWENRIVGHGVEDPAQLMANPLNWRVHPRHQREALLAALERVGWVANPKVNRTTGHLVDGHLRVDLALERGEQVPVDYVDLTEEEERIVLASLDPLSMLAVADADQLEKVMSDLQLDESSALTGMLADLMQSVAAAPPLAAVPSKPEDFWPRIVFQLPPEVNQRWKGVTDSYPGEELHQRVAAMLDALDS